MDAITLKQLRYVEALARLGHFGRAAEACAVTQPALSMQIKALEETLGMAVFDRAPGRVRLTGFGETVLERARAALAEVDALGDLARAAKPGLVGRLRLGVIPTVAPYLLPRLIAALSQAHPEIDLQIRETLTPHLLDALGAGQLDCALLALPVSDPGLSTATLFEEDFVLIRPARDADKPVPDAAALAQMRLLLLEEGHCFRDQALEFCNLRSPLSRYGLEGSSLATLVQMVGAGIGVTLLPEMAVRIEQNSAPVAVQRFSGRVPKRRIGLVWRANSPLAGPMARLAQTLSYAVEGGGPDQSPAPVA